MQRSQIALAVAISLSLPVTAINAQLKASPRAVLTQTIDSTDITIIGSRPSMRGRQIFGDVRKWGVSWTPGANWATTLEVGRDFKINNKAVPAGVYSVWMVPRQNQPWLMMLDPRDSLFHVAHPDSTADQYHFPVNVQQIDPVETLTWNINEIRGYSSLVSMEWADKRVEFSLKLESNLVLAVHPDSLSNLLGSYVVTPSPADTNQAGEPNSFADSVEIVREDDMLRVQFVGGSAEEFFTDEFFALSGVAENLFIWAELYEGEPIRVYDNMFWEFLMDEDQVTGFEVRMSPKDNLWLSAKKTR